MDRFRFILGLLLVIALPPGLLWWFVVHPFVGFWRRRGTVVTMTVMTLFFLGGIGGLFVVRTKLMGPDIGTNPVLVAVGLLLLAVGFSILRQRKKHLTGYILAGFPEIQAKEEKQGVLLDQGIYARIRHPRYVEILFITFGYAAISNFVGPWITAFLSIPAIHAVVLLEERELRERFGDAYRDYAARVPRYFPR